MRAADYDVPLARAQAGVVSGWADLATALHKDLEVFVAGFAADQAMVDAVCEECWPTARAWLDDQRRPPPAAAQAGLWMGGPAAEPVATLVLRLRDQALSTLRVRLADCDRQSIANQDALLHLILQSGLDALPHVAAAATDVQQVVHDRLAALPPATSGLLARRYREGLTLARLVEAHGRPAAEVAAALAQARTALDWQTGMPAIAPGERDLPLLIEQFLDGTLAYDVRLGLVQSLLDDLGRTAYVVRQIRLDLVLSVYSREAPDGATLLEARRAPSAPVSARRPVPAPARTPAARKPAAAEPGPQRWLVPGAVALAVLMVGIAIALLKSAPPVVPPPVPATGSADPGGAGRPANGPGAQPPAAAEIARVEAGQPTVLRGGDRVRLQPGGGLRADEGFEAANGPVSLALGGGRTLAVSVNSLVGRVQADAVVLERGQVRVDAPAGTRGVTVRVGQFALGGDGATFTVSTGGSGLRVEAGRGEVRLQRGGALLATVLAEQAATVNGAGELALTSGGAFVAGIDLGGPGATVDGRRWKSQRHALADGLTVEGGTTATLGGLSGFDEALKPLLETGLGGAPRLTLALPDGSYDVIGWVAGRPGGAAGTLTVNGQGGVGDGAGVGANGWRKLWPRRCTVSGGRLDLTFAGGDQQLLVGLAIHACAATGGRLPPTVFLDEPADDQSLVAPVTRVFKADPVAPNDSVRLVEFLVDGAKVGEDNEAPYLFQWTAHVPGVHRVAARVHAANGLSAVSATITLTVKPPEKPKPALLLTVPEDIATAGAPLALAASAEHVEVAIARVVFLADGAAIGEAIAKPWRASWAKPTAGEHVLTAVATLAGGATLSSAPRTLVVQAPAPTVAIDSPLDGEEVADNGRLVIRVRASAPEGRLAKVEFTAGGQKIGEASAPPFTFTWPKATPGWHQLGATAIDAAGGRGNAEPVLVAVGRNSGLALVRGIDLGGEGVDLDGGRWLSHDQALAGGLTLGPGKTTVEAVTLTPDTDAAGTQMLATAYEAGQNELKLAQELPDGLYLVALWMAETRTSFSHACDLELQGVKQLQPVGRLAKGAWAKYGPFPAKVRNQRLALTLRAKGGAAPKLMGLAIYAPAIGGGLPRPLIELLFDTFKDNTTPNTGLAAAAAPAGILTTRHPQPSRNLPPGGGAGSVDFAKDPKSAAVDLAGGGTELRGLKSFTITAWVNSRDNAVGRGGNRLVSWCLSRDGVDLACHDDGSIGVGVNTWNDIQGAERSSPGRITASDQVPTDNWRFIAVTYDSTAANRQVRYYFGSASEKAALDRAVDYSRGPVGATPPAELSIGHLAPGERRNNDTAMFRGLIDQVRIWGSAADGSGALSAEQVIAAQTGGLIAGQAPTIARAGVPPLIELLFDSAKGNATPNTGSTAAQVPAAFLTTPRPQLRASAPPGGGAACLDLGKDWTLSGVDLPGAGSALRGLKSFTISAWVNCLDRQVAGGGSRIFNATVGGDGIDLAYHGEGQLHLGVNDWNNVTFARSSGGKITDHEQTPADNWRFLAVTYDSTAANRQARFYFGSAREPATLDVAVDYPRGPVGANPPADVGIGSHLLATRKALQDNMFHGLIDQVRLYGSASDGSGALSLEQIVALQAGRPVIPRPAPAGGPLLVEDFEQGAPGWEYVGGWEFPGAKGTALRDQGTAHGGQHAYRLDFDFTGGGVYVGTWKKFEGPKAVDVSELRLWVKAPGQQAFGVRLADGSDQVHQSAVRLQQTAEWQEVVIDIARMVGGEHWGGANDGKWHPPLKGFGLNVGKGGVVSGTAWFDDLSVVVAPAKP